MRRRGDRELVSPAGGLKELSQNSIGRYVDVAQIRLPTSSPSDRLFCAAMLSSLVCGTGKISHEAIVEFPKRRVAVTMVVLTLNIVFIFHLLRVLLLRTLGSNPPAIEVESPDALIAAVSLLCRIFS